MKKVGGEAYKMPVNDCDANSRHHETLYKAMRLVAVPSQIQLTHLFGCIKMIPSRFKLGINGI